MIVFDGMKGGLSAMLGLEIPTRQTELLALVAGQDFEAFYDRRKAVAATETASLLILTTDAKGIVMLHDGLREGTRKAAQKQNEKRNRETQTSARSGQLFQPRGLLGYGNDLGHGALIDQLLKKRQSTGS